MPRKYTRNKFDDEALDALYRSDPTREWSLREMANAANCDPQSILNIQERALRKLRAEMMKRGMQIVHFS